jgi:hypothetical protein
MNKDDVGQSDFDKLTEWVNRRSQLLSLKEAGEWNSEQRRFVFQSAEREELKALTAKINKFHASTNFKYA